MEMPGGTRRDKNKIFKDLYLGECVEIVMAYTKSPTMPLIALHGFVLEVDDNEIHLGETPDSISFTIPRFGYKMIAIMGANEIFSEIEKPNDSEIN